MLEIKDLYKVYKPKRGVAVTALNGISLKFPDTGMIFLLGKSGSGKSTLLNVLGGLDRADGGEILIKGVSSKNFNQQHFDSYRNTYVGFIFQEYNVLEEFTVGANIALAIELQGRRAEDEEIDRILKEVDLEGYGDRKPNELSGGQKQRVAIARALVKNPDIIMADEPTGALDSNTGKQVFDTLKKLSEKKLVIVVSHDRDFAERYADRIIELADGSVISDVELSAELMSQTERSTVTYNGDTVTIPCGYHLTEQDREDINRYIDGIENGDLNLKVMGNGGRKSAFVPTNQNRITHSTGGFKLIKSKLPMKSAFKIGASGLKYKKIRLVVTIFLSCIAFGLFGLSDTFGSYNHIKACTNSLSDSKVSHVSLIKSRKYGSGIGSYWDSYDNGIGDNDLKEIEKETGIKMAGVFCSKVGDTYFESQIDNTAMGETNYNLYSNGFTGFVEVTAESLGSMNCRLIAGELPDGSKNEIAISKYICETFKKCGYAPYTEKSDQRNFSAIKDYSDMLGRQLHINGQNYTVSGIIDTDFDFERYLSLSKKEEGEVSKARKLINYALYLEFNYASHYSLADMAMVGPGHVDRLVANEVKLVSMGNTYIGLEREDIALDAGYIGKFSDIKGMDIEWIGEPKKSLADKEVVISSVMLGLDDVSDEEKNNIIAEFKQNNASFDLSYVDPHSQNYQTVEGYKVVGIVKGANEQFSAMFFSDTDFDRFKSDQDQKYNIAIGAMPENKADIRKLVAYCNDETGDTKYEMQNSVTFELDSVNEGLKILSKVFFWIGIGFAVFAAIMLANFIATSISHKKQEIGILRAIGSRSNDVFRIFFSESFLIAAVNFVLSSVGVFIATMIINIYLRKNLGILVTVLSFGPRQILLMFAVSMLIAFAASFIPVKKIASKRPIDAIRNR